MLIYKATNTINGHVYIGQTRQKLKERMSAHKIHAAKNQYNSAFHAAIRKYGFDAFEWSVIDTAINEDELNQKEAFWIAEYKKTQKIYNMTNGGENPPNAKGLKRSAETRRKMSEAMKGRKLSPESIKKMAATKTGKPSKKKGTHLSEETKKKLSEARKKYFERLRSKND